MCDEDTAALVVDNGSGMCKVQLIIIRKLQLKFKFPDKIEMAFSEILAIR